MELAGIPEREQYWTADQVVAVKVKPRELKRLSIGLAVSPADWLGHRDRDVLSLTWTTFDAGTRLTKKMNARAVLVPSAYPKLGAEIAAERTRHQPTSWSAT